MTAPRRRCALYTRKSSDEGLDQEFNSLDAQREACAAYVKSQSGEGWKALPDHYDDGGFSGGTMERPALRGLMADVVAGKIDIVVVYKIDRLSRSLADFVRMVETFDRHDVSFVSVTQSFNTTSSMGRLTLNILLSFAQFEREVTGERIRDKIAASKKKGMWMGGHLPLGYDLPAPGSRSLVVNPGEARTVRHIFTLYRDLGSVHALEQRLREDGIVSKRRETRAGKITGGQPFSRGALFYLLRNRTYLGKIPHHDISHPGLHSAIVDPALFATVQDQMDTNARRRGATRSKVAQSPLTGRLFDVDGQPMSPTFAYGKGGKLYRYYVSAALQQGRRRASGGITPRRISAAMLENTLTAALVRLLPEGGGHPLSPITRAEIHDDAIDMLLPVGHLRRIRARLRTGETADVDPEDRTLLRLSLPVRLKERGYRPVIVAGTEEQRMRPDPTLVRALRNAHAMLSANRSGNPQLAEAPTTSYRRRLIRLAFLAPDLQRAILEGRQPSGLTMAALMEGEFPLSWATQRKKFGTPHPE